MGLGLGVGLEVQRGAESGGGVVCARGVARVVDPHGVAWLGLGLGLEVGLGIGLEPHGVTVKQRGAIGPVDPRAVLLPPEGWG